MTDDGIDRRLDTINGKLDDLSRWLRDHGRRVEDAIALVKHELRDHERRIGDLRQDVQNHAQRITALEAARKDTP